MTEAGIARIREGYAFAFDVGIVGGIILVITGAFVSTDIILIAHCVWLLITLFVLPRLYVYFTTNSIDFGWWKGPQQ